MIKVRQSRIRVKIAALVLALIAVFTAFGQTPTGEITGTVKDTSGAVIPDATVTVTNTATGAIRSAKTNTAGIYDFAALNPGAYNLKIEKEGFSAEVRNNIELQVAQVANFDSTLNTGNVSESVTVEAGAPILQTEDATTGTVIENKRVEDLPLNGRNLLSLTALTPGVSTTTPSNQVSASREGGTRGAFTVSASGQRVYFNFYSLDGTDDSDVNFNAYIFLPSLDGIQEFKVETGILPAEYGHNLTQINVTTKSGSNQFHGGLFEFIRNSDISAKNFFDKPAPNPIPPFKRNQFGGDFGGPIIKNKLFFFADYEGLRERKSINKVDSVPTAAEVSGNFQGFSTVIYDPNSRVYTGPASSPTGFTSATPFPNNTIPLSDLSPIVQKYFSAYIPLPNVGSVTNSAASNYITALVQPTNNDNELIRADYLQNPNMNWMIRYTHSNEYQAVPGSFTGVGQITNSHVQQGMIGNTWTSGAGNKVNDFRISINYLSNVLPTYNSNKNNVVAQLGIGEYPTQFPFDWGVPGLAPTGFSSAGEIQSWQDWDAHLNIKDNFSWIVGKHTFKFGGEYGRERFNGLNNTYGSGSYNFTGVYSTGTATASPTAQDALADLLEGNIGLETGLFGEQIFQLRWNYFGLFAEDTWKATAKLTVTYGLRWEDQTPPTSRHDNIDSVIFNWNSSITPYFCRQGNGNNPYAGGQGYLPPAGISIVQNGSCTATVNNDPLNFGPRVGVAYSMNSKTVLRGGGGIFFAHEIANEYVDLDRNVPWSTIELVKPNPVQPNINLAAPWPPPLTPSQVFAIEPNEPTSRSYQWSLGIQRELYKNASLEADYVGSSSPYLSGLSTYDSAPPGPGAQAPREPFPQFGSGIAVAHNHLHASFNQLQVKFQQRYSNGFSLLNSFSYGKSIDNGSSFRPISLSGDSRDPSNPSDVRGVSSFSFKFRNATSALYELPFGKGRHWLANSNAVVDAVLGGWQAGAILTLQSGFPMSAFCTSATTFQNGWAPLDNSAECYPNATGINPNSGTGIHIRTAWFNTTAFANQTAYSAGNAGRDTIIGPGITEMDASLIKHFRIREGHSLEFRAEAFNIANHPIWNAPGTTIGLAGSTGVITSTLIDSREFQGSLKYTF